MSVGADIEAVLNELGTTVIIDRLYQEFLSGDEYDEYTEKIELSAPERTVQMFYREFLMDGSLHYRTQIDAGDILTVMQSGIIYLTLVKTPEIFEDEVIEYRASLYRCNTRGIILRQVDTDVRDSQYKLLTIWMPVYRKEVPALFYDHQSFDRLGTIHSDWSEVTQAVQQVYLSTQYYAEPQTRFRVFLERFEQWREWDTAIEYKRGDKVFTEEYKLYKAVKQNVGNDPKYSSADYSFEDEYYTQYWKEIPYRDYKLEKADMNRFDNVVVYMAVEDLR